MTYQEVADSLVAEDPSVTKSKMFGMPCLKLPNGKVFAGDFHGDMTFKLGADGVEKVGAAEFEPMEGRAMRGWALVPATESDKWLELARQAHDYTVEITN